MIGEQIYKYNVDVLEIIDFGQKLSHFVSGKVPVKPYGARVDAHVSGTVEGRLAGKITGSDFLYLRPDGRMELDIRARIECEDGCRVALHAAGVGSLRDNEPAIDLVEHVRLYSAFEQYEWVNGRQIWAHGVANLSSGKLVTTGYLPK